MGANIHDKFIKTILSDKDNAKVFLKTFLPEKISNKIDFSTLKYANKSFISDELKETFADIIFECNFKNSNQSKYISILLEHKS